MDPSRPSTNRLPSGTRLNGIYEIDLLIGSGGMGEIYKSHEIQTGSPVAIKMLLPEMAENDAALALFRKEASALHYLMHDAIVRYFVFTVEPVLQRPYLAMEFVDGRSLSELLEDGPLTFEALLRLTRRLASGLHAAHQRGIVHRDVSPDNVIIPHGDVSLAKIIDFGIARSNRVGDATVIGFGFAGKHSYVSPEQIGLFGGDVTARSDIYSLGLVMFYALTGQKLDMGGNQFQLVEKRRRVPDLGAVDMRIRPLLEHMLQPDPANRPSSMAEIENWAIGSSETLQKSGRLDRDVRREYSAGPPRSSKRRWIYYGAAVAGTIMLVVGGAAYYYLVWNAPIVTAGPPIGPTLEPPHVVIDPPNPPLATDPTAAIRRFVDQYNGGDCFFVTPVAISSTAAVIEGLGASTSPFDLLDKSFSKTQGFEPSIGVRLVTAAQCPAITFLNRIRGSDSRNPRISLDSSRVKNGETLTGMIDNFASRVVELLLITDAGQVQNLSYLLKPGTDAVSFAIGMQRADEASGRTTPQIVMAVATPRVLDSLRQTQPTPADQFFLQVLSEAQRANLSIGASVRYFQFEK